MWSVLVVFFCVIGSVQANNLDCHLPKHSGVCQARDPRFYFDVYAKQCRKFIYGGCGGNANNFKTLAECKVKCMVKTKPKRCLTCCGPPPCCSTCNKPGICAPPIIVPGQIDTICVEECNRDDDCQGEKKCCPYICGRVCSIPTGGFKPKPGCLGTTNRSKNVNMNRCVYVHIVKPGFCPPVPTDIAGVCVDECSSDDTCQGEKKCCSNGCGHFCSMVTGGVMPLPAPCRIGKPLPHIFCGRGPYRQKCPKGYYCNNDRGDRFPVCCQRRYS